MTIYFLFLDGVGLGLNESTINPLASGPMPYVAAMLGGVNLLSGVAPLHTSRASLLALDANLGISGLPQSATGQAVLITGVNVPLQIGYHYGPKPDPSTAAFLRTGGIFGELISAGKKVSYLNAYPQRYFDTIDSGRRLYSSFPQAAVNGGIRLLTVEDLRSGLAVSADITGEGWPIHLGIDDIPLRDPYLVGKTIVENANIAQPKLDLAFFEYWATDYAGHKQDMTSAIKILGEIDAMIAGIADTMQDRDLILVTSDHGNIEDLAVRGHTSNPVPLILVGSHQARQPFMQATDLSHIVPGIRATMGL